MKRVIVLIMAMLNSSHMLLAFKPNEQMEDMGASARRNTLFDDDSHGHYRLKRTASENYIAEKLKKDFELQRQEQEKNEHVELPQPLTHQLSDVSAGSLTSLTVSENNNHTSLNDFRINTIDIAAKLIRLREVQNANAGILKEMSKQVTELKTQYSDAQLVCGPKGKAVIMGTAMMLLLFITAGVASLIAAHY